MLLLWQALATGGLIMLGALLIDLWLPHRETRARRWWRRVAYFGLGGLAGIAGRLLVGSP
ncbi:hypothetical protein [Pseudomonas oryzihabitans]|uniref:hypothetical protein n=1 Tax=Pseudomonas oryzihabitans TaxID=47885 RepID=UPI0011A29859|nr:hypothetical protein [Pseudomonas psychrotolerans]